MRITIQLDAQETAAREVALARNPDDVLRADHEAIALARFIGKHLLAFPLTAVDLNDVHGYLYTLEGEPK